MADVARVAGVSTATVSRVLARYPYVSEKMRRRVEKALKSLGYEPNRIARSLRTQATRTIGLVIRDAANVKFGLIAKAAQGVASSRGYYILVCSSDRDPKRERECIDLLLRFPVDGLILYVADERMSPFANHSPLRIPVVLVESALPGYEFDEVCSDNISGARTATEHLLQLGHRNVAFLHGPLSIRPFRERLQGYLEAFRSFGIRVSPQMVVEAGVSEEHAIAHANRLLDMPSPPTAIFAASSALTVGVLQVARIRRLQIPRDLSVVGFDDTDVTAIADPPLTVVSRDICKLGATAVEVLLNRLTAHQDSPAVHITLPTTLCIRSSSAPPPLLSVL